jgi:hypothetical protein
LGVAIVVSGALAFVRCSGSSPSTSAADNASSATNINPSLTALIQSTSASVDPVADSAMRMVQDGRQTFRYDTFGDEAFWGDTLKLHQAIEGSGHGGVGPGVSPKTALGVGLKVDMDALPASLVSAIKAGNVDLDSPETTLALLDLNAVVGVTGFFDSSKNLTSVGIQCALCHSTVDDAFAAGIGHRLDGWPNRDLNVGAVINLAPDLTVVDDLLGVSDATVRAVLLSWGVGKFDAELLLDGKATRPNGASAATLIPPAFGLAGVNLHTWEGWGSVPHWNAFVANLEMHGKGTFFDPRLDDATVFPIAAKAGFGHLQTNPDDDRITSKLPALQVYQLSIVAPTPSPASFNTVTAFRGRVLFNDKAKCASCHTPPLFTEPGWNMHTASEIGIDDFQASRSPDNRYRTSPLKGLFTHTKGGFYHDGRFATLLDVVKHYDKVMSLGLTDQEQSEVVEYLKSL